MGFERFTGFFLRGLKLFFKSLNLFFGQNLIISQLGLLL